LSGELPQSRAEEIARAYLAAFPLGEQGDTGRREQVEAVAAWLAAQSADFTSAIQPHVHGIIADAHLIGGASADSMVSGDDPDLGGWQPGDTDSARQRCDDLGIGAGLPAALGQARDTAQQVSGGCLAGLARTLIDGAQSGLGAAAIGASLVSYLTDPANAQRSVLGMLAGGIASAAVALYSLLKVQRVNFVTEGDAKVCPRCDQLEAGSPYRIGNAPDLPVHPGCRCALTPS
jgi:hypothetical protein